MASPGTHIRLSHWLGPVWGKYGLNWNIIVNPEGVATGSCEITAFW